MSEASWRPGAATGFLHAGGFFLFRGSCHAKPLVPGLIGVALHQVSRLRNCSPTGKFKLIHIGWTSGLSILTPNGLPLRLRMWMQQQSTTQCGPIPSHLRVGMDYVFPVSHCDVFRSSDIALNVLGKMKFPISARLGDYLITMSAPIMAKFFGRPVRIARHAFP